MLLPVCLCVQWKTASRIPDQMDFVGFPALCGQYLYWAIQDQTAMGTCTLKRINLDSLSEQNWETIEAPLDRVRRFRCFFSHGDSLYVLLKSSDELPFSLHQQTQQGWKCVTTLLENCDGISFGLAGSKLIVVGGKNTAEEFVTSSYTFDLAKSCWSQLPDVPVSCRGGTIICHGSKLSIIGRGGFYSENPKAVLSLALSEDLSLPVGSWSTTTLPETPCYSSGACLANKSILLAGGYGIRSHSGAGVALETQSVSSAVFILDKECREWLPLPELVCPRLSPFVIFHRGKLVCLGGLQEDQRTRVRTIEVLQL